MYEKNPDIKYTILTFPVVFHPKTFRKVPRGEKFAIFMTGYLKNWRR